MSTPSITSTIITSTMVSSVRTSSLSSTSTMVSSVRTSALSNASTRFQSTRKSSASCTKTVTTSACGSLCVPTSWAADTSAVQSCSTSCFSTVVCSEAATTSTRTKPVSCPLATFTTVSTPAWLGATWSAEESFLKEMTSPSVNAYSSSSFAEPSAPTGSNSGGGGIGSNEGGSASNGEIGIYGVAVIPAPGASSVVPPLTSDVAVSPTSGANSFAPPSPLTVVPPLSKCSLVRWVFLNHS